MSCRKAGREVRWVWVVEAANTDLYPAKTLSLPSCYDLIQFKVEKPLIGKPYFPVFPCLGANSLKFQLVTLLPSLEYANAFGDG
jgi:hypothetical protein